MTTPVASFSEIMAGKAEMATETRHSKAYCTYPRHPTEISAKTRLNV